MKIQFLNGGLANQAFQYIFARHYELSQSGDIMYLDDSYFAIHTVHNGYELERVFGIKAHMLSECFDKAVWEFILEEKKKGYRETIEEKKRQRAELLEKYEKMFEEKNTGFRRLINAFPDMISREHNDALQKFRDHFNMKIK